MTTTIVFVCPHGAAKSVMAAAYFQQLADQNQLDYQAICAGTEPDPMVAPRVADLLRSEKVAFSTLPPRKPTADELESAERIISLGCTDTELGVSADRVEHWNDVPAPSQNFTGSRDAIFAHVESLISTIQGVKSSIVGE